MPMTLGDLEVLTCLMHAQDTQTSHRINVFCILQADAFEFSLKTWMTFKSPGKLLLLSLLLLRRQITRMHISEQAAAFQNHFQKLYF